MSDYTKIVNYAAKDALVEGDPNKIIKGTELDAEFVAIQTAIGTKSNLQSPTFTGVPRAPTAAFGTNTTQLATTAFVQANSVPVGGIIMWSGLVANIPQGYALCDGSNGTPDLVNKFILAAGDTYSPADTGGAATVVLTTSNLPSHAHGLGAATVANGGGHTHTVNDPGHAHYFAITSDSTGTGLGGQSGSPVLSNVLTSVVGTNIEVNSVTGHTHSINGSTDSVGSAAAVDILPPYFALAYIMRTA